MSLLQPNGSQHIAASMGGWGDRGADVTSAEAWSKRRIDHGAAVAAAAGVFVDVVLASLDQY